MKIIQVVNNLDCGGQEKMLIRLALALKARGSEGKVLCIASKGALALEAETGGIKVESIDQREGFSLLALARLCWSLIIDRPDVLHLHNSRALIYGSIAGKILNIPCVFTRHGSRDLLFPKWLGGAVKHSIAISAQAKNDLLMQNPWLRQARVSVILNGVDVKSYGGNYGDTYQIQELKGHVLNAKDAFSTCPFNSFTIGHVARLSAEKDQATLLKAFAEVLKVAGDRNVRLVIAGDGVERHALEKLAHDLGIAAQVEFLGFRNDIPAVISTFDVFVLSSLTEGISLTLLEAMAASKPVVATHVGGNSEVVVDDETGFLVPAGKPQAMAEKIIALLNDQAMAKKMGDAGRHRVEEHFSLERMTDEYEKVYREVVARC